MGDEEREDEGAGKRVRLVRRAKKKVRLVRRKDEGADPADLLQGDEDDEGAPDSLLGVQRSTLSIFAQEFLAWTGLDGYHGGKPTGDISSTARIRFAEVEAAALKRVAVLRARAAVAA